MIGVQRLKKRRSNWSAKPNLAGGLRVHRQRDRKHERHRTGNFGSQAPTALRRSGPYSMNTPMRAECIPADAEWPESNGLGGFASGSAQDARTPSFAVTGAAQ
jgi:hypothetical protein